ncbi:winged helix-turn-helix domain-containing protein [Streptomyces sp. NBC_00320]|uniref:AfsR/SARP family transcriptional regulator n=1 Tax=Streptomyces sp. NBC_00320 TaxID=2975711 RepID=UPI00225B49F2|nr:BTAD domain-containing putative transcriptional regulator [Streptomyces sp. NBC_00320]MCX5146401.1 winged helix-turn-helix domain-containing protein [Streptomyces sp. NBC_00320]
MLDDLQFDVFGPLTVRRNGELLEIPQAKHRVVLAALLLRANRTLTAEELIQQLWGGEPPLTARKTLQGYIARLRKVLGADVVVSRASGYAIAIEGERLDLDRFNLLLHEAELCTEPAERARLFRSALEQTKGTPLVDIPSEYLHQGDGAALLERWLNATESWADAEMAVGRCAEVLPRLRALVSEHPFRESAWGRLMTALYKAGRQGEALTTYQEARRLLSEELGVEPGEELRAAHRQILTGPARSSDGDRAPRAFAAPGSGGGSGEGSSGRGTGPRPVVGAAGRAAAPYTLPPRLAEFARPGIEAELIQRLRDVSRDGAERTVPQTLNLYGAAGVGKTTMAVRVAHAVSPVFPDGQLYVELQRGDGFREPADVLGELVRALGVAPGAVPAEFTELVALYRGLLSHRRVLIVLDGARDEAQVRPLLPASPTCAAVVTSLEMLSTLGGTRHVRLGLLSAEESREILARIIGRERVAAEEGAAQDLVRYCGRLPLAIRIVGARLLERPHWRLETLARRLESDRRRLDELVVGDLGVRESLAVGYAALDAPERRAFRLLSLLEMASFPVRVAAAALGLPDDRAEEALERLTAQHLLDADFVKGSGVRFSYHPLVRLYARELTFDADSMQSRHGAVQNALAAWYTRPAGALVPLRATAPATGPAGRAGSPGVPAAALPPELGFTA